MNSSTKWILGLVTVLIFTSIIYIQFQDDVKIRVDNDKTTFYIKDGRWLVAGREFNQLFDGTSKMYRSVASIKVDSYINENDNTATITRETTYIRGPKIVDTYTFNGNLDDVELFPIKHTIEIYNAKGYFYRYEVRDLTYDGDSFKLNTNEMSFGKKMKVEWEDGYRWARVYKSGILKVQYDIPSDYVIFENRLFDPDSVLTLDGTADNQTYEYETTANLSTDFSYITVYDNTGRYVNYSVTDGYLLYLIDTLRYDINDFNTTSSNYTNLTFDSRNEMEKAEVNVTGYSIQNAIIQGEDEVIILPGLLNGNKLYQREFIYSNTNYTIYNLTFESAETKTIYINYSSEGRNGRTGYFNFTVTAYNLDADNAFNHTEDMENLNTTDDTDLGTITNTSNPYEDYINVTENFKNNDTASRWDISSYYSDDYSFGSDCDLGGTTACVKSRCRGDSSCDQSSGDYVKSGDYWVIANMSYFQIQAYGIASNGAKTYLEFYDGTNSVNIATLISTTTGSCGGCHGRAKMNLTFRKVDDDTWNISSACFTSTAGAGSASCPNSIGSNYDISSLNEPYYLRWKFDTIACDYTAGTCTGRGEFSRFSIKGPQLNKTNVSISGIEGVASATHTGNYTTSIIETTASDVTRVLLNAKVLTPTGTSVNYYLSNDDGTTFESVTLNEQHLFSSTGNDIRARFELSSTSNISTPIVTWFYVEVQATALDGLDIDIGANGTRDVNFSYELNSTTTPVNWTSDDSSINYYIFNNCENESDCLIPIAFTSGSGGIIEISNLNLTEDINPLNFSQSTFEGIEESNITATYTGTSIFFDDWSFDFRGSKNISVAAHTADLSSFINFTMNVVYSSFDLFFPSKQDYWQIFPSSRNQSDVEPYGQNSSHGIWNINTSAYDKTIDIYTKYNETLDSCVTKMEFRGQNFTANSNNSLQTLNITNLTTTTQKIVEALPLTEAEPCYQETANETTACGGLATGKYHWGDRYLEGDAGDYFYVNYTIPSNANSNSLWVMKKQDSGLDPDNATNYTIPNGCWDSGNLTFRIYSTTDYSLLEYGSADCYNGSDWINLTGEFEIRGGGCQGTANAGKEHQIIDGDWSKGSAQGGNTCQAGCGTFWWGDSGSCLGSVIYEEAMWWIPDESGDGNIWTYTQINCSENTDKFIIPYFCFFSLCTDCVKTYDWEDTCEIYE